MRKRNNWNDTIDTFLEKLVFPESGCWIFTGCPAMRYPAISCGGVRLSVHRLAYELFVGAIPDEHDVHHTCENRRCCCPEHLKALTELDHYRLHKVKTHCNRGHEFTPENTYFWDKRPGQQMCCECRRQNVQASRKRRKGPDRRKNRTHCAYGHAFTPENTYLWNNGTRTLRHCRECQRRRKKEYRAKRAT